MANCDTYKIDSNATGLRFAFEECIGELPQPESEVEWLALEPNSYSDFGATVETMARSFISEGRQRKKGVITSVTASGGFNQDLTQNNAQQLLSAFLFADIREKTTYQIVGATGQLSVTKTAGQFARIEGHDFVAEGLIPGEWIFVGGDAAAERFDSEENNGFKRIREVTDTYIVIDKSDLPMKADAGAAKTITIYMGRVLKNESAREDIVRKTMQFERTLGSLDGSEPPQAEYLIGAVASGMTLNMPMQDKITADFSFIAIDHETRTPGEGLKEGNRPDLEEADAFNTSDHVRRIRIGLANESEEATDDLFGYATDLSISVDNTLSPVNAIGRSVAFDVTAGTFAVSGSIEAYFSDIRAVRAVRNNEDITLDCILVREGAGIVIDMPLTSLGGGQANVVLDQPIMLPLTSEAATGAKIDAGLDHTLLFMFFDELPSWAE